MDLSEARAAIDVIDDGLLALLKQRFDVLAEIAAAKDAQGLPVADQTREDEIIRMVHEKLGADYAPYGERIFHCLFIVSRAYQQQIIEEKQTEEKG